MQRSASNTAASYSFDANLNARRATSSEQNDHAGLKPSPRKITEKTAERIRERVESTLRVRVLHEIEETNVHEFTNTADGTRNLRGVYRWLTKRYEAQNLRLWQADDVRVRCAGTGRVLLLVPARKST